MHLGLNKNSFWFLKFKEPLLYETAILGFDAFLEFPRRIGY
jgi:hypothetical protein